MGKRVPLLVAGLAAFLLGDCWRCAAAEEVAVTSATVSQVQAPLSQAVPSEDAAPRGEGGVLAREPFPARAVSGGPVKGALNLDLNYPGAALRYFVADGKALEILGQFQKDISVGGLRYYSYPASLRQGGLCPYFALEADYVDFKGAYSKGSGLGGGAFAGAEYFLGSRVSVQTDLGALYLSVKDKETSLSEGGLEFVLNVGVNIYFGKGGL